MKELINKLNRLERKHLGLIIFVQFLFIGIIFASLFSISSTKEVLSETTSFSEGITEDIKACLSLSEEERVVCAKLIGVKIANSLSDPAERLKECSKFRPYAYTLQCEEGLSEAQE